MRTPASPGTSASPCSPAAAAAALPEPESGVERSTPLERARRATDRFSRLRERSTVPGVTRAYNAFLTTYLLLLDLATIVASFALAALAYRLTPDSWFGVLPAGLASAITTASVEEGWLPALLVVGPVLFLPMFALFGLYQRDGSVMNVDEARRIVRAVILGSLIFFTLLFFLDPVPFPRGVVAYAPATLLVGVIFVRMTFYVVHQRYHRLGLGVSRALVYGAGATGRRLARKLERSPGLGFAAIGYIDDDPDKLGQLVRAGDEGSRALRVLGTFDDIPRIVREQRVQHLFVAVPSLDPARSLEILRACEGAGVGFSVIPSLYNLIIHQVAFNDLGGIPLMTLQGPRYRVFAGVYKRIFDVLFSSAVLLALSPLYLLITLLVKLDSPGPAFFAHTRVGKDGREFLIYKFRSMYRDVPPHGVTPTEAGDPRVTRLGSFLRRFSLDELPQFLNVLKGDMSTVGPRPEMPFIVNLYSDYELQRLNVRPGVTGLWQISEDRAGEIHANMDYDIYYIENQSILLDLIVVVATVFFALRGKGAH